LFFWGANKGFEKFLGWYLLREARKIVELDKNGFLSKDYGYAWHQINEIRQMSGAERDIIDTLEQDKQETSAMSIKKGRRENYRNDLPSLSAISELNRIKSISNNISIVDRNNEFIGTIKTTGTRAKIKDLNDILIYSVIYAEDKNFFKRDLAYEYDSFVRAAARAVINSIKSLSLNTPVGVSTIPQQVAKYLISKVDSNGFAYVDRSIKRKITELKLAQAIKLFYTNEEILEIYLNNCVSAGKGFVGYIDISRGLFKKEPKELNICESLYLSRLLKWNRNIRSKIIRQCRIDIQRIAPHFGWDTGQKDSIIAALDTLTTYKPKQMDTEHGHLIDLANEYWLKICTYNKMGSDELDDMDLLNPNALVRTKGNLRIQLHIDMNLQRELESLVNSRGYGNNTTMMNQGQYYSYAMMNSLNGQLLAYFSRDKIGSRLNSLVKNRIPNGSAVAKPILNALALDLGIFNEQSMLTDSIEAGTEAPWHRKFYKIKGKKAGLIYMNSSSPGGYMVCNHDKKFFGYDYYFNHLAVSNNLIGVETIYRLNTQLYDEDGRLNSNAVPLANLFFRMGIQDKFNELDKTRPVTGVRIYKEIANCVGIEDSVAIGKSKVSLPDNYYSVALGTLEMSLLEQMHLFNVLYEGYILENPANRPGLFIKSIYMGGREVPVPNSMKRIKLFPDLNTIKPALLGLHKRLAGNPQDSIRKYDIELDSACCQSTGFKISGPLSNFAKSGTTDDIITPYNRGPDTPSKTNYCLWNAVIRIRQKPAALKDSINSQDIKNPVLTGDSYLECMDITIACIGEGNRKNTGPRDGKTLHKFLTKGILEKFGKKSENGFFKQYEEYLLKTTPDSIKFRNPCENPNLDSEDLDLIDSLEKNGITNQQQDMVVEKKLLAGTRIGPSEFQQLLILSRYMGSEAHKYFSIVKKLRTFQQKASLLKEISGLKKILPPNKFLREKLKTMLERLETEISRT
ncbi:MAG: transglycosylase domain-containing protein, partial [bacterium]